jgi:hypothetical protein
VVGLRGDRRLAGTQKLRSPHWRLRPLVKGQGRRSRHREVARSGVERRRVLPREESVRFAGRRNPTRSRGLLVPVVFAQVRGARPQGQQAVSSPRGWAGSRLRGLWADSGGAERQEGNGRWSGATRDGANGLEPGGRLRSRASWRNVTVSSVLSQGDREAGSALVEREPIVGGGTRQLRPCGVGVRETAGDKVRPARQGTLVDNGKGAGGTREGTTTGTRGTP